MAPARAAGQGDSAAAGGVPRVLYVNHTSLVGGGEHSLLTLLSAARGRIEPLVASPEGALVDELRELGVPRAALPATAGSLKLHPLHTPRAVGELALAAHRIRQLIRSFRPDVVHANSIRAGLAAAAAAGRRRPPLLVHVRDVLPPTAAARLSLRTIAARATIAVANSEHTEAAFLEMAPMARTAVAHSPIDLERFDPDRIDREAARGALGLGPDTFALVMVGYISPLKAQSDGIRIAAALKERHPDLRLLIAGSVKFADAATRHDNVGYLRSLESLVGELGMEREVELLGERDDVPELLRAADMLLLPSWEEGFGRVAAEAMAMALPVAVTDVGGTREVVQGGEDGLLLPPRSPDAWVGAIEPLVADPERRAALALRGQEAARRRFGAEAHVDRMLELYEEALRTARA